MQEGKSLGWRVAKCSKCRTTLYRLKKYDTVAKDRRPEWVESADGHSTTAVRILNISTLQVFPDGGQYVLKATVDGVQHTLFSSSSISAVVGVRDKLRNAGSAVC